ncbi:MAG: helix-turn-helix domain-containing protein [Firmicutes bacterium]|nr:helix-turn-helix domain-containing protein [Bacillota bacterium]
MRMIKGLSAYELSLRVGKDTSYIYKVETGRINVSIKVILDICEVLEISPKDLF